MDKKEKIIVTAMKLFVKQGFENTPTSQISKESGVATGTLFHHFKTKEELLNAAYLYVKQKMISAMQVESKESIRNKLKKSWISTIDYGNKHSTEIKFMMIFSGSSYITKDSQKKSAEIFKPFIDIFAQGVKDKVFKDLPIDLLINTYYSMLKGIYGCKKSDKKLIETGFEMVWDALKR